MFVHIRARVARLGVVAGIAALTWACNGPPTPSNRGFEKPPLTVPGVVIEREQETEMSRLGEPNLPPVVDIPAPEPAAGS